MLRLRVTNERQPRTKNGAPAHSTTGVDKHQRNPVRPCRRHQMHQAEMAAHLEHEDRQRQRQRDPEPPRHVDQFGIRRVVERDLFGLQRHAADRATCPVRPAAPPDASDRCRWCRPARRAPARVGPQEFFRLGFEALAAARAAEEIVLTAVDEAMLCGRRIDLHAADRIDRGAVAALASCWPPQQACACAP